MKSLQESLFDKDLTASQHPVERILKTKLREHDIIEIIDNMDVGDFGDVRNKPLKQWAEQWYQSNAKPNTPRWMWEFGTHGSLEDPAFVADSSDDIEKEEERQREIFSYLKLGKIHKDVSFNDAMYANDLDISWDFWGGEKNWDNITEWIIWRYISYLGDIYYFILVNRKEFSAEDQLVIHKMIEDISKSVDIKKRNR